MNRIWYMRTVLVVACVAALLIVASIGKGGSITTETAPLWVDRGVVNYGLANSGLGRLVIGGTDSSSPFFVDPTGTQIVTFNSAGTNDVRGSGNTWTVTTTGYGTFARLIATEISRIPVITNAPATCTAGDHFIDSDGGTGGDTDCAGASTNIHLCFCVKTNTYYAVDTGIAP